jgi:putative hydrolase of the HAD superfamily
VKPKFLLVDSGGVLFRNVTEETPFIRIVASTYDVPEAALLKLYESMDSEFECGKKFGAQVLMEAVNRLNPLRRPEVGELMEIYSSCVVPHEEALGFFSEWPREATGVGLILANNEAPDWDCIKNKMVTHLGIFEHICSSWILGHVKPSGPYFDALLAKCGATAEEVLIIDDSEECVDAARELGMQARLYSGIQTLHEISAELIEDPSWTY